MNADDETENHDNSIAPLAAAAFSCIDRRASTVNVIATSAANSAKTTVSRQIFFCNLDGFDTHGSQLETQVTLLQQ